LLSNLSTIVIAAIFFLTLATLNVQAQNASTGALTGTVTDATGAVVSGVEIKVTSESTGETRSVVSQSSGVYVVPLLPPGTYRIEGSKSGFKEWDAAGIRVNVTETATLNIQLQVGSATEKVTVSAMPSLVQTETSSLGSVTDEKSVQSLPLVTRNYTQIIGLSTGASVGVTDASQLGMGGGGMANFTNNDLSVNGARSYDNNFLMDGVDANDIGGVTYLSGGVAIPNPDSIAEFKVQTGQYDASYGRNAGANVDVVTKSGSNQFHGNLFEFFRNDDLNANSFFFKEAGVPRGVLKQNQFGGTIGGPIKKDKLLFFGSYQGTRQRNGIAPGCSSTFAGPPLTNDRSAAALGALYGGQSGLLGGVAVAPDGSNINPVALTMMNWKLADGTYAVPTPQAIVGGQGLYAFSQPCPFTENQFLTNLDYVQSAKSKLTGKFFYADQNTTLSLPTGLGDVPGSPGRLKSQFRNVSLTHDYTFTSNLLNEAEFGFHRTAVNNPVQVPFSFSDIGVAAIPQSQALPFIVIGPELLGNADTSYIYSKVFTGQDSLNYVHGKHNLRVGGGVTHTDFGFDWLEGSILVFLSMPDVLLGQSAAQNGSYFSNVYGSEDIPGQTNRQWSLWNPWLFAQDSYKVTRNLTLNLGLRYERIGDWNEVNGRASSFDVSLADPNPPASGSQAGYVVGSNFPSTVPLPAGSVKSNNESALKGIGQNTFGPRVGFSWQVLPQSTRLVLRGGYGIYYSTQTAQQASQNAFVPPWAEERFILGIPNAGATFATPYGQLLSQSDFPIFPAYSLSNPQSTRFPAPGYRPAITQQYSLNLQTQLANNLMLEVGYVGARGTHLIDMITLNQAGLASASNPIRGETTNTLANLPLRVPFEGFLPTGLQSVESGGASWYNGLNVSLTKRFSHGLQFLASYTFSRLLDTETGQTIATGAGNSLVLGDQYSQRARYGASSTVRPQRLVVSFVYELPKPFSGGIPAALLNNWGLSGVATYQSGHALTIYGTNGFNVYGITGDRAELASGCTNAQVGTKGSVNSKLTNYFNTACVGGAVPWPVVGDDGLATGFGNIGYGDVRGPDQRNWDLAVTKHIPVGWFHHESMWEFRAEFFNAFNTPEFADPDPNTADGTFGFVSGTAVSPRILQFALKYNF
jgi:outer membrane receptor protein involved in Fe transport